MHIRKNSWGGDRRLGWVETIFVKGSERSYVPSTMMTIIYIIIRCQASERALVLISDNNNTLRLCDAYKIPWY